MSRSLSPVPDRPTALERTVLDALAWELGPDNTGLSALLQDVRVARRFPTGSGFVNTLLDQSASTRSRGRGATGLFGSIHVVFEGLPDAVGFQLQLKSGAPIALIADAYHQDTSELDLARARYRQIFFIDAQGRSLAVPRRAEPAPASREAPRRTAVPSQPVATLSDDSRPWTPPSLRETTPGKVESTWSAGIETAAPSVNQNTLRNVIWVAVAFIGVLLGIGGMPWVAVGIGMFMLGRFLTTPPMLARFAEAFADQNWGASR